MIRIGFASGLPSNVCQSLFAVKVVRSMASAYCMLPPVGKGKRVKMGDRSTCATSARASITKGLPAISLASNDRVTGTSTVGIVVVTLAGAAPATA